MLTVSEAAKLLHLSAGRTRILAEKGQLKAEKVGRQWLIYERSVENRLAAGAKPGRPKAKTSTASASPDSGDAAYSLYRECVKTFSNGASLSQIAQARTPEERAFYVNMANFFLAQKCSALVEQGVF